MIKRKSMVSHKGVPCVYIGIGLENYYGQELDTIRIKIGLSRDMGNRRRGLRYDTRYLIETIEECPIPYELDSHLYDIESQLHIWLHNAPTARRPGGETDIVDYHVAEYLIEQFPYIVRAIARQYEGA